jgi:hypothetical protein
VPGVDIGDFAALEIQSENDAGQVRPSAVIFVQPLRDAFDERAGVGRFGGQHPEHRADRRQHERGRDALAGDILHEDEPLVV